MARTNGKSKVEPQELDLEHELPASDGEGEDSNAVEAALVVKNVLKSGR